MIFVSHIVDVAAVKSQTDKLKFTGDFIKSIPGNKGVLNDVSQVDVNAAVDIALNTAIPGSPVVGSINANLQHAIRLACLDRYGLSANDDLLQSNDVEETTGSDSYIKMKEILCKVNGTLRVKFDIKNSNVRGETLGKIHRL